MTNKGAIDYRKYYINYYLRLIEDSLNKIKRINTMPDNLIRDEIEKNMMYDVLYNKNIKEDKK